VLYDRIEAPGGGLIIFVGMQDQVNWRDNPWFPSGIENKIQELGVGSEFRVLFDRQMSFQREEVRSWHRSTWLLSREEG
jgi:hypothetical protein